MKTIRILPMLALLLFSALGTSAQITTSPNPVMFDLGLEDQDHEAYFDVTNDDTVERWLLWRLIYPDLNDDWFVYLCDLNTCYDTSYTDCPTSNPNVLAADTTVTWILHITPNGAADTGSMQIEISYYGNPFVPVHTLDVHVDGSVVSVNEIPRIDFDIYPNPAPDQVSIRLPNDLSDDVTMTVYDLTGKVVRQESRAPGSGPVWDVKTGDLANGVYQVRLTSGDRTGVHKLVKN